MADVNVTLRACPLLPPVPQVNRVTGQIDALTYQPCIQNRCAFMLPEGCAVPVVARFLSGSRPVLGPDSRPVPGVVAPGSQPS